MPPLPPDPHLPLYHFQGRPWMNDPMPFFWQGDWHVFYQHNPRHPSWAGGFGPEGGSMHWGHAVSRDLVRWQQLPVALAPTPGTPDQAGVWTGSVVAALGGFYAFYTSIASTNPLRQTQSLATSEDLITWEKYRANPLIFGKPAHTGDCFRDPQVWQEGEVWYMLVGSEKPNQAGGLALLYRSTDLLQWSYRGVLAEGTTGESGHDFECPDFFPLPPAHRGPPDAATEVAGSSPTHVLLTSRTRVYAHLGTYVGEKLTIRSVRPIESDLFYAAKTHTDDSGRRLMFGWIREPESPPMAAGPDEKAAEARGWSGVLSLPRELYLTPAGHLGQRPAAELTALRGTHHTLPPFTAQGYTLIEGLHTDAAEFRLLLLPSPATRIVGLALRATPDGTHACTTTLHLHQAKLDSTPTDPLPPNTPIELRVFLDRTIIESFCAGAASTGRTYPPSPSLATGVALTSDGPVEILTFEWWDLAQDLRGQASPNPSADR